MPTLNLNSINKLFYSNTEAQKLYRGGDLLYPLPVDPHLANVVLHLKGDGANNSTSIVDSSPTPKTITRVGDTKISTVQSKYGGSSIYFDGSDSLLTSTNTDFTFGTGDWTIEVWVYTINRREICGAFTNGVYSSGNIGWGDYNNTFSFYWNASSIAPISNYPLNQWVHLALTRQSNVHRSFINGVLTGTPTTRTTGETSNQFEIGTNGSQDQYRQFYTGYMDSFRITKGVARYTSNFNPETDTYLAP